MTNMTMPVLHVGRASTLVPLSVFPVWTDAPAPPGLVTGRGAQVRVAEHEGSPVVEELMLTNYGNKAALLLRGELLEGGWQHRVLQHDMVLAAGESRIAAVACVEAGRWQGEQAHRRRARSASPTLTAALSTVAAPRRQEAVWQQVARYDAAMGFSPTSSFVDHLKRLQSESSAPPRDAASAGARTLQLLPGQRGVLVGLAGQPLLLELFPSTAALSAHLDGLLAATLLDARVAALPEEPTPGRRARRLVERLDGVSPLPDPTLDAGAATALTADSPYAVVRGVMCAGRWAHLSVLNPRHPLLAAA